MQKDAYIERLDAEFGTWFKKPEASTFPEGKMTQKLYPYEKMFEPIQINRLKIKNRLVMAPMDNSHMCDNTGRPAEKMVAYFAKRAKGGVGLITTGHVSVSYDLYLTEGEAENANGFSKINNSEDNQRGWRDLTEAVHAYGTHLFIELSAGDENVAKPCQRLSGKRIKQLFQNMGQAAADARECGIDGIYLNGHGGNLLDRMTNPAFRYRKQSKNVDWQRFGLELVKEIRARVGDEYPIMYRIELSAALNETIDGEMSDKNHKTYENGRQINDTLLYMENLVKAGVDAFDVDLGCYENLWLPHPGAQMPAGCYLGLARIAKKYFEERHILSNAGVPVPIAAVGKLGYPDVAEEALREQKCDMIMLGRPLLADPEWPHKAFNGRVDEIRPCVGCQEGCLHTLAEGGHLQCAVNAETGFEDEAPEPQKADVQKRIAIVGAGPAGCACAIEAARRGHTVDLFDAREKVGGKLLNAGALAKDLENYRAYLEQAVSDKRQINLKLGRKISANDLKDQGYDVIVSAMGNGEGRLKLPGMENVRTATVGEVLADPHLVDGVQKIAVIGGQDGLELALWLAAAKEKEVSVLESSPFFLRQMNAANRGYLLYYLKKHKVSLYNVSEPISVENGRLVFCQNKDKSVPDPYDCRMPLEKKIKEKFAEERVDAEMVIFAIPDDKINRDRLFEDAARRHLAPEVYNIGDSFKKGKILDANRAGSRLGRQL